MKMIELKQKTQELRKNFNDWFDGLERKDKWDFFKWFVVVLITYWAYATAARAYDLALLQEQSRIQNYMGESYQRGAMILDIQKCHITILGEPITKEQEHLEKVIIKGLSKLDKRIKDIESFRKDNLKHIETVTLAGRYTGELDHYRDLVSMRFKMSEEQIKKANLICLGPS